LDNCKPVNYFTNCTSLSDFDVSFEPMVGLSLYKCNSSLIKGPR
jgi:hypothetical protein